MRYNILVIGVWASRLYFNQMSWEMCLFKEILEVYHTSFKYQHKYVFSSLCLSKLYFR